MKEIHVECHPDETLAKKLGFPRKNITHHSGKSRILSTLSKSNQLAIVDEDPGGPEHPYQKKLTKKTKSGGVTHFTDKRGNNVFELEIKLEDWIISICKRQKTDLNLFGLNDNPNKLHKEINNKLRNFEKLLDSLLEKNNPELLNLKKWLLTK